MSAVIPLHHPALRLPAPSCRRPSSAFFHPPPGSLSIPTNPRHRYGIAPAVRAVSSVGDSSPAGDGAEDRRNHDSIGNSETADEQNATEPPAPAEEKSTEKPKNILSMASWAVGALFCVAIPFYKKVTLAEDIVENIVVTIADEVEKVAPMVKKIAEEVEESLPKSSKLIPKLDLIEKLADDVAAGAEKAEAFVGKVDKIFDKVEETIDPLLKFKKPNDKE